MISWKLKLVLICVLLLGAAGLAAHAVLPDDILTYAWDQRFTETPPPVGPVRPVAEFEPASHVLIRYPLGIPTALVTHLSNTAQVICLVSSTSQQNTATNAFNSAGANMANISFMIAATDSYWTRDYGPWFAFDGAGDLGVVDFVYNRPRPNDNMIPQLFAQANGLNYYGMNLTQTGGNYMTDGINTAAQTHIAYSENGNNQANVDNKMLAYLGVSNYLIVTDPNATYINHIDCWGKFLAPDKVLIRSVPTSHAQYAQIEAAANYFATHLSGWGYPYKVYRVYTPNNQPYTNSLILNNKVFVPIMNSSNDAAALQVYRTAMPGYEVIGITGASNTPWESTDALHCRTHEIPDKDMLHISHTPYHGEHPYIDSLLFSANIRPYSDMPVYADSVYVSYRINSGMWQNQVLSYDNGTHYMTSLGGFAPGDTIRYYIHAADGSGRSANHPVFARLDPHVLVMEIDSELPQIIHMPFTEIVDGDVPILFTAMVFDNSGVASVKLRYKIDNGAITELDMVPAENGVYIIDFLPQFEGSPDFFYYNIVASDLAGNTAQVPEDGMWYSVPISGVDGSEQLAPVFEPGFANIYPNPVRKGEELRIDLNLPKNSAYTLSIYNLRGQQVFSETGVSGSQELTTRLWNGRDNRGNIATNGIYFARLETAGKRFNRKLIIAF